MKISFLGDISLNDKYVQRYSKREKPFGVISNELKNSDIVIGNLECMAKGEQGENHLKKPRLTTNTETLNYLNDINIGLISLANNHIYDHLLDGYQKTVDFLENNNILYIGSGKTEKDAQKPILKELNGITFCFLNYVTYDTNPNLPKNAEIYINFFDKNRVIEDIKQYRQQVDQIILLLHWGGRTEHGYYPGWHQPRLARELVDAGADLIVGHHSHTIQPYEKYNGKYIFYSLGNFCFEDIYFENEIYSKLSPRKKKSIILEVEFREKGDYTVNIIPIRNQRGYIELNNRKWGLIRLLLRNFIFQVLKRNTILWKIYYLKLNYFNPIFDYFFIQKRSFSELATNITFNKIANHFNK